MSTKEQNRLVAELRLAGANTTDEANRVLEDCLPRFNARFSVPASQSGSAYRRLPQGLWTWQASSASYTSALWRGTTRYGLPVVHLNSCLGWNVPAMLMTE